MADQVQCPNCGGYKVLEESLRRDPKGGLPSSSQGLGCSYMIGFGFAVLGLVFLIAGLEAGSASDRTWGLLGGLAILSFGLFAVVYT